MRPLFVFCEVKRLLSGYCEFNGAQHFAVRPDDLGFHGPLPCGLNINHAPRSVIGIDNFERHFAYQAALIIPFMSDGDFPLRAGNMSEEIKSLNTRGERCAGSLRRSSHNV